jgi:hypothetical protein
MQFRGSKITRSGRQTHPRLNHLPPINSEMFQHKPFPPRGLLQKSLKFRLFAHEHHASAIVPPNTGTFLQFIVPMSYTRSAVLHLQQLESIPWAN